MTVTVLAFGIVKEIFGDSKAEIEINESTVTALKMHWKKNTRG
jgi:hypothetical protein